jgi:squalene-hopene/tetraprenyl-beta-curcumene cyclase
MRLRAVRFIAIVAAFVLLSWCCTSVLAGDESEPMSRGTAWLLGQQAADGGWHSQAYGQMSSGVGNTALVLDALTKLPQPRTPEISAAIERGIDFLLANLAEEGYVSAPHQSADYPTYATAILLRVLNEDVATTHGEERSRMRGYLLSIQRQGRAGERLAGGWPQVGGERRDALAETNVNISVTRFVLEGLRPTLSSQQVAQEAALEFLARCQNDDGGFCFIPLADDPLNKAGENDEGESRSYGTATADGLAALVACGVGRDDARVGRAVRWLEMHPTIEVVPGFPDGEEAALPTADAALKFYYYAGLAQAIEVFSDLRLAKRADAIREHLAKLQSADGSWANPVALMKENDPLIATSLAVSALATLEGTRSK